MAILEVTSREFRDNQKTYFDLVDKGQNVIIRRGRKQSYMLTPIKENDIQLSPETEKKIQMSREEYKSGKAQVFNSATEAIEYLKSL